MDPAAVAAVGHALANDGQFVIAVRGALDASFTAKLEDRLAAASKSAESVFSDVQKRMEVIEQNLSASLETMNTSFAAKLEDRMGQASKTAEGIFGDVAKRVANLELDLQKSQEAANNVIQRLKTGGASLDERHKKVEDAFNTLNAKIDNAKDQMERTRVSMSEDFERTKSDLRKIAVEVRTAMASSEGTAPASSNRNAILVTLKETTVDRLPESVSKADFENWVEELYVHIDRANGCAGMSSLLKEVRLHKTDLTEEALMKIVDKVHDADNDFDRAFFDYRARDKDLYAYLLRKLNKKLKALVAGTKSGFETFRRIMREEDPVTESTEYSLRFAFQQMVFQKSTTMEGTRKLIQAMEKKISEYREKTGKEMDELLKTTVIHGAMDSETGREVRRNRVELTYEKIKGFVEELYQEEQNRAYATRVEVKKTKPDAMEVGNLNNIDSTEGQFQDLDERESQQESDQGNYLNVMGKGKGKGKGSSMECYRCGGHGHPARDCPTPEGSTANHQCYECGGKGHYGRDHKGSSKGDKGMGKAMKGGKGVYGKGGLAAKGIDFGIKGGDVGAKGGKYGMKGYGSYGKGSPGKGWNAGPRSMNSVDNAFFATMGAETDWEEQSEWARWGDVSAMGQAPWQEPWAAADPWQTPRQPGGMSLLSHRGIKVKNRYSSLEEDSEEEQPRQRPKDDEGKRIHVEMQDLLKAAKVKMEARRSRREASRGTRNRNKTLCSRAWAACPDCPSRQDGADSRNCGGTLVTGVSLFTAKGKEDGMQINNLTDYQGWKAIEVTFDSGACDIVMPLGMCAEIPVQESERQRERIECEVANGETIPNEGERRCLLMTVGAKSPKRIVFQVADVHKALLSITRVADAGYECHLNKAGGYLLDTFTGEKVPISRRGNLYVMKAWVREDRTPAFGRQGS